MYTKRYNTQPSEEIGLYGASSPFLSELRGFDTCTQPRSLRTLAKIVSDGLCHRCGSCIGICPTEVLRTDSKEYPVVSNLSACTDCGLCAKVCPGDEFNVIDHYKKMFGTEPDLKDTHGIFKRAVLGYSPDNKLRRNSTSGGIITALLVHMLESGQIDGAVVTGSDEKTLWKGEPKIARTKADILAATKSKYAISPTNVVIAEILKHEGKYAFVGLPCQIHGILKAASLNKKLKERVAITIGLICHAAVDHEAFEVIWDSLGGRVKSAKRFISRVGKHPGTPALELENGEMCPVYFPEKKGYRPSSMEMINILYRLYTPMRCTTCFDAMAEFADIAVGDPWMPPPEKDIDFYQGWSFALARTARGDEILKKAIADGAIVARDITRFQARECNLEMAKEKRNRAAWIMGYRARRYMPVPFYGIKRPSDIACHRGFKVALNIFTHIFCFFTPPRRFILKVMLSNAGYILLWVNNKRRSLKRAVRHFRAKRRWRAYEA
ncbi:MAG: 4Fe-4S dicluster domain-containing protein [Candidatus Dadabacteria bacterium]|nr:MAG: 4Fe-4S dicluster domain-containing protein [Candidatus Dadabacteria bacterium]